MIGTCIWRSFSDWKNSFACACLENCAWTTFRIMSCVDVSSFSIVCAQRTEQFGKRQCGAKSAFWSVPFSKFISFWPKIIHARKSWNSRWVFVEFSRSHNLSSHPPNRHTHHVTSAWYTKIRASKIQFLREPPSLHTCVSYKKRQP